MKNSDVDGALSLNRKYKFKNETPISSIFHTFQFNF